MTRSRLLSALALAVPAAGLLAGCTVGPDYHRPAVAVPPAFGGAPGGQSDARDMVLWWHGFGDPLLDRLVEQGLQGNLDVRQAAVRIEQARAQERATRANGGPRINASAQGGYNQLSSNALPSALTRLGTLGGSSGGSSALGLAGEHFTTFQTGFDASWEIDLLGGQRRANEAARARTEAALWTRRDAQVMLAAEVARTYQDYRMVQRRIAVMDQTIASQRAVLDLVRIRSGRGLTTTLDERRQQGSLDTLAAQREDLDAQAQTRVHALGTLLGLEPMALAAQLRAPGPDPVLPDVPPGLPSALLQRRPDVRAAERRVAAATADIGVATADLYPKFSLTGAMQLASRSLTSLVQSDSILGNGAGRLSMPVIGGAGRATVQWRKAQAREAVLAYQGDVLTALRDVEDALTRLEADRRRVGQLAGAQGAARDAADTMAVRFAHGLVTQADVQAARQTWLTASDSLTQAQGAAAQDVVALYKALGGGWDERRVIPDEDNDHGQ